MNMRTLRHLSHRAGCLLLGCLFAVACSETEYEYSHHRAYFIFDNSIHLEQCLSTAMNPMSPGIFCRISISGLNSYRFENNQGLTGQAVMTAVDQQRTVQLGTYNESGVIVGYGSLDNPPTFYAYDAQCPNCYEKEKMPKYQLTMNSSGKATCRQCQRAYDLNNGGIISQGAQGDKLIRYRATITGPMGILSVNN